jgi:hypothetical protein
MKHCIPFLVVLLLAPLGLLGQGTGPRIQFESTDMDICAVYDSEVAKFRFVFWNAGDADLVLSTVKTSTGAAVAEWPKEPIRPGGSGEIKVQLDCRSKRGEQRKNVTITSNDPQQPVLSLTYRCHVLETPSAPTFTMPVDPTYSTVPAPVDPAATAPRSTCPSFEQTCKEGLKIPLGSQEPLVFYYTIHGAGTPFEWRTIQQSGQITSVEWEQGHPGAPDPRSRILVWFDTQQVGPFSNSVILETSSPARPLIYLHFDGRIVRDEVDVSIGR